MSEDVEFALPVPDVLIVCRLCGQPWTAHEARLVVVEQYVDEDGTYKEWEVEERRPAHWTDCIALLKAANRGPMGPPGAIGAPGPAGMNA